MTSFYVMVGLLSLFSLKSIDLLGPNYELSYKGKTRKLTSLGGFFTIIIVGLFCSAYYFFGRDVFERTEPITRVSEEFGNDRRIYLIDQPIIFSFRTNLTNYISFEELSEHFDTNKDIISLDFSTGPELVFKLYELIIEPCSKENLKEEHYEKLESDRPYACVNPYYYMKDGKKERYDLYYENSPMIDNYAQIIIQFLKRQTSNELAEDTFDYNSVRVILNSIESYINLKDFSEPYKTYLKSDFYRIDTTVGSLITLNSFINEVITDTGLVFQTSNNETFYNIVEVKNQTALRENDKLYFLTLLFSSSQIKNIYNRRYVKLQEILANVGGFMKACLLLSQLLLKTYSEYKFFTDFKTNFNTKKRPPFIQTGDQSGNNIQSTDTVKPQITFLEYLGMLFSKKKAKILGTTKQDCFKYTDISFMATKFNEIQEIEKKADWALPVS